MIYRLFVEKKDNYNIAARRIQNELKENLRLKLDDLRIFLRYDIGNIEYGDFMAAVKVVFSEPPVDQVYFEDLPELQGYKVFGTEYLPGQYDQRADSASQCVQLLIKKDRPLIKCAVIYAVKGITQEKLEKVKKYLINPVESRECSLEKYKTLKMEFLEIPQLKTINNFHKMSLEQLEEFYNSQDFAMSFEDLCVVFEYFKKEKRDINEAELKVIDTYWSDHCRHTTFLTELKSVEINSSNTHIQEAFEKYQELFNKYNAKRADKYRCLMDIATIAVKELKNNGRLKDIDESEEINACSIKVKAKVDGQEEDWLVMFKNETHNHPTEIEPFGGAATCLGGAIRDPLSGRVYVYQAMRVTGAADITEPIENTIKGKLPQRVISRTAAAGYSSYGNQIGLATGLVTEIYHPNYAAKRLETGFVVGAAKADNVVRQRPKTGDIVVLIGGETGRDGIGGATGSSKAHTKESIDTCGAEVQKGNPLTERKIQRLFRNPEVSKMIKRCNDFGAGGVCVAIGELADGLKIDLDAVPKKYEGLGALELAVSESQERMAVVIEKDDFTKLKTLADEENVNITKVAEVTDDNRMVMTFQGKTAIDLSRDLLNTNGAKQTAAVNIKEEKTAFFEKQEINNTKQEILKRLKDLNITSQKGLGEMFDSTIGAATVLMPFGGKYQITPAISMAAKLPTLKDTDTCTVASFGYNPYLMSQSPFVGAVYSVVMSVIKVILSGVKKDGVYLTFQEYFLKLGKNPDNWGIVTSALLGAMTAQLKLGLGAIGGKDSMSGTFENINVPPTLISFALGVGTTKNIIDNVLKESGKEIIRIKLKRGEFSLPNFSYLNRLLDCLYKEIESKNIKFAQVVDYGGAAVSLIKSAFGNSIGLEFSTQDLFDNAIGDILITADNKEFLKDFEYDIIATTVSSGEFIIGKEHINIKEALNAFTDTFKSVYPVTAADAKKSEEILYKKIYTPVKKLKISVPKVFIPVFPGTNCEYDTAKAFEKHKAAADILVIKNRTSQEIEESVQEIVKRINNSQIIAFPGGFSGGDEPDGSGKFIAATFSNPYISDAVGGLLQRGGLIIGICNGFQALIKLGLLPYGKIKPMTEDSPTLTFNNINRHISKIASIKIVSKMSPWLRHANLGQVYGVPISHGEGKFVSTEKDIELMKDNGQIFSQYCSVDGDITTDTVSNPNGSFYSIEGLTSPDGRILGKMGHIERTGEGLLKNTDFDFNDGIIKSGVEYFE